MGYKITYYDDKKRSYLRMVILSMLFFAVFILWTFYSWDEGKAFILDKVFPVSVEDAENAIVVMVGNLKSGENFEKFLLFLYYLMGGSCSSATRPLDAQYPASIYYSP